ncbi:hypothetical protein OE88DRAFT_1730056 [Heliocybe sulcata]|uniref:Uncharacterized protein n=1 Tax=Heliocybe sulcata TaxID=5364 RepID=A0A5C3NFA4_9AGAM|nr:hypothetical protein OE88DRAFT_1730056 [Heliocybe sulcata]
MATRRRIGVSLATTEAARRQLMAPVPCWEKVWIKPDSAPAGSTLKVYKWVKTEKKQQFSDDESEVDAPLAPLPDEPEVVEGDEEGEQEETAPPPSVAQEAPPAEAAETAALEDPVTVPSPKAEANTLSLDPVTAPAEEDTTDTLDDSLKPLDSNTLDSSMDVTVDISDAMNTEIVEGLDLSGLPPDGTSFEDAHDLTQMQEADALLGGPIMDQSEDPFGEQAES